jgi:DNA-binding response OmpR family regulator
LSELYLLTSATEPPAEILPALGLLLHPLRTGPAEVTALTGVPGADAVLVDARRDLVRARELCRMLRSLGTDVAVIAIMTEGGLAAVTAEWGTDDVLLHTAGPAEVEARLRLAIGRQASTAPAAPDEIRSGDLSIDEATYTARLRARVLDLTFKEFELLKFLVQHPGRVFTRDHLLQEVWGYDYFGGTRTVDVHVRRLRAKLGPEHEALIGTVRNVGYRFVPPKGGEDTRRGRPGSTAPAGNRAPSASRMPSAEPTRSAGPLPPPAAPRSAPEPAPSPGPRSSPEPAPSGGPLRRSAGRLPPAGTAHDRGRVQQPGQAPADGPGRDARAAAARYGRRTQRGEVSAVSPGAQPLGR